MGGSKKFKDKICVYCRINKSTTADHIFPWELFQIEQRQNLPKAPSCEECNNEKSKLEHYLTTVLPFGATHSNSTKALTTDVGKRLGKNQKLHREMKAGSREIQVPLSDGSHENRLAFSLDYKQLHKLIEFIGRGLMWHHWQSYLPLDFSFIAFTPSQSGIKFVNNLFQMSSKLHINIQLGDDTVRYKGVMSETETGFSVWAIQLLGGMTVSDDNLNFVFSNSFVALVTGPETKIRNLKLKLRS